MERARNVAVSRGNPPAAPNSEMIMSASNSIVVASAARTAVGSFNGAFANTPAHELGAIVIKEVLARAGVDAKEVDEVILGQVLTAGQGQNPARQASIAAGLPIETTAWGLNQVCGSGLRAIALGMQQIA
jgi:acetyl-CoA C-acetyltransferase